MGSAIEDGFSCCANHSVGPPALRSCANVDGAKPYDIRLIICRWNCEGMAVAEYGRGPASWMGSARGRRHTLSVTDLNHSM
jgi:hypothetical protein